MKTLKYMENFSKLNAKEKVLEVVNLRNKIKNLRETKEEKELKTILAVERWTNDNFITPKITPPTMEELTKYINEPELEIIN